jgi:hypothetical protein
VFHLEATTIVFWTVFIVLYVKRVSNTILSIISGSF